MESHSYINTATMPSGEYGSDPQDVVGRNLGRESGREGPSSYATETQRQTLRNTLKDTDIYIIVNEVTIKSEFQ